MHKGCSCFYVGAGDLNSHPQAYRVSVLPSHLHNPRSFFLLSRQEAWARAGLELLILLPSPSRTEIMGIMGDYGVCEEQGTEPRASCMSSKLSITRAQPQPQVPQLSDEAFIP